jgi:hypothetical protein
MKLNPKIIVFHHHHHHNWQNSFFKPQPSSEDPTESHPVLNSLHLAKITFLQRNVVSLASNPSLEDQVSAFMSPSDTAMNKTQ